MLLYLLLAGALVAGVIFLVRNQGVVLGITTSTPTGTTADQVSNESPVKGWSWWSILLSVVFGLVVVVGVVVFLLRRGYFKKVAEEMGEDDNSNDGVNQDDENEKEKIRGEYREKLGKLRFLIENNSIEKTLDDIIDANKETLEAIEDREARRKKYFELVKEKIGEEEYEKMLIYSNFFKEVQEELDEYPTFEKIKQLYKDEINELARKLKATEPEDFDEEDQNMMADFHDKKY